ncbi:hypothetical protein HTZ84_19810 [Haloterrigena sp. SYSU A558-1]|uniref:Uncharacterized protein n=3 Tax=Haloterrigena TaxID=121871 RepID=M0CA55_9EURY|nr:MULTISPECIES: DUF5811 family protein [Haloterrigena]ADB62224.1 hypothetical protein Htur_3360 [Haloterrigena turkmenica DSM 5511]ELZ20171.1 hypothetical protein C477_07126 [Haloterrigena salina JCM 13891]NUB89657.1 hypothetical protein [Haloterrigena gelatinilytica]NUC74515.1 hypothetical protein [Haloterrigena gelatinilytica]
MNGNTPYAGLPGETGAGQRAAADVPDLSRTQKRSLHRDVSRIAARTRDFLPDEYVVDSEVSQSMTGPQVTVAVRPPIGHAVSAGFTPDLEEVAAGDAVITADERDEVARGLAASAALQVKQAISDNVTPTAK